ncbi:MAG: GAF domain-containing protein [Chloroflexi bacterium]|nr:MAG: GAF domain-containing protein [Chloroflexota bacterium]
MQEPRTWRQFLATVIREPKEKQRIASEVGVDPITLTRWSTKESSPRPRSLLNRLVNALPSHREQLSELIREEFPNALEEDDPTLFFIDSVIKEVPSVLYARILEAHANVAEPIRMWTICNLVIQQLVRQIDPEQVGIVASIMQCLSPSNDDQKVHSLRVQFQEKSPAMKDVADRSYFLGAESLVGQTVVNCRPAVIQDIHHNAAPLVVHQVEKMNSAAAYPLQKGGRVAGGLLILSTQKHYFSPARQALIQSYAHLLNLAFRDNEFYPLEDIALQIMPSEAVQDAYLSAFNQQVNELLSRAERNGHSLARPQAERMVIEIFIESMRK